MKRTITAALICAMLMTSCSSLPEGGASAATETTPVSTQPAEESVTTQVTSVGSAPETTVTTTAPEESDILDDEEEYITIELVDFDTCEELSYQGDENDSVSPIAKEFIAALYSGDAATLRRIINVRDERMYNDLQMIDFNRIDIKDAVISPTISDSLECTVEMDIASSDVALFPEGKSTWTLKIDAAAPDIVKVFQPADKLFQTAGGASHYGLTFEDEKDNGAMMCYLLTSDFTGTDNVGDTPSSALYKGFTEEPWFYYMLCNLERSAASPDAFDRSSDRIVTGADLKEVAERIFGEIDGFDLTVCGAFYDAETDILTVPPHGGAWMYENVLSHDFDKETGTHTVVIEYYADSVRLELAKVIKYTFWEDENGYYHDVMQSLRHDCGLDCASACV